MNSEIKNICLFCSSSNSLDEIFYNDAALLGELLAKENYDVVYGGSALGLMYRAASAAKKNGSRVIGVMPEKLYDLGVSEKFCDEFYLTSGMRERKAMLDEKSDAVIALAGGFGTLEELTEMIVQKQLCYNNKPIVILNTAGYYDDLLKFFENIAYKKFATKGSLRLYHVSKTPEDAVLYIKNYKEKGNLLEENLTENVFNK